MDKFTFRGKYATYQDCYFFISSYGNGNLALEVWNNTEGPINRITTNPDIKIPTTHICVKNYAENEGIEKTLKEIGIIEGDPVQMIHIGYVTVPVYPLTSMAYEAFVEGD